jgi:transposase
MMNYRLRLSKKQRDTLRIKLKNAEKVGDIALVKRLLGILAISDNLEIMEVSRLLGVTTEAIRGWIKRFLVGGISGLIAKKSPGRPPKLTKTQRKELARIIDAGPAAAGFVGNCWRSPMIQHLIHVHFGVFYAVNYISQLLKSMGFSYQKARFVSDHLNPEAREEWLQQTWPEILAVAKQKQAYLLFGDEASFPQWGTLSYTWAKKGQQPTIETSGKRKGYKVFGLIDYFTGRFFFKCQERRLTSETYKDYLNDVLRKTRKHIVLVQDGARYHTSAAMNRFFEEKKDRLTVFNLPSYSPDYNPIEKLWKKIKEKGTHLHYFPTFDALKEKVEEALIQFSNSKHEVLSLFGLYQEAS